MVPALICIVFHELCHGFAAFLLGDDTAKRAGRLSLNPLKHVDVTGLIMMVVFRFGWAKPVPVNMSKFKNPKRGMAITALAGPVSNLLLAFVFMVLYGALAVPFGRSKVGSYFMEMLVLGAYISIGLAVFNFIPVPPLDGSKILLSVMSNEKYALLMRYERYGMIALIALVASGILGRPLSAVVSFLFSKIYLPAAMNTAQLVYKLFY